MSNQIEGEGSKNRRLILLAVVLFIVASTSFALGYLASERNHKTPIIIEKNSTT
jgi:hypothetical protein